MNPHDLSLAFAVWAAVVALVGGAIVYELSRLRTQVTELAARLTELTVDFEHRLTVVESDILRCERRK